MPTGIEARLSLSVCVAWDDPSPLTHTLCGAPGGFWGGQSTPSVHRGNSMASQLCSREVGQGHLEFAKQFVLPLHPPEPSAVVPCPPLHVRDDVLMGRDEEAALPHGHEHLLSHLVGPQDTILACHPTCAIPVAEHPRGNGLRAQAGHLPTASPRQARLRSNGPYTWHQGLVRRPPSRRARPVGGRTPGCPCQRRWWQTTLRPPQRRAWSPCREASPLA